MEVVNPRAALLSNYEVLKLLKELDTEHLSRTKATLRVKKEEEASTSTHTTSNHLEASENLRTIEVEAMNYLQSDYLPLVSQTEEGIAKIVKDLAPFELTKAEKLQIVNLAPTMAVELYVIVEELEDRFGDRIDDILSVVQSSLTQKASPTTNGVNGHGEAGSTSMTVDGTGAWDEDADAIYEEDVYDDIGEGAGVEGDLDMEDD